MTEGCVVIAGYGPGLGRALADAFAAEVREVVGLRSTPDAEDAMPQSACALTDGAAADS